MHGKLYSKIEKYFKRSLLTCFPSDLLRHSISVTILSGLEVGINDLTAREEEDETTLSERVARYTVLNVPWERMIFISVDRHGQKNI